MISYCIPGKELSLRQSDLRSGCQVLPFSSRDNLHKADPGGHGICDSKRILLLRIREDTTKPTPIPTYYAITYQIRSGTAEASSMPLQSGMLRQLR